MPQLPCSLDGCDNEFYRPPSYIKKNKTGKFYCSNKCKGVVLSKRGSIKCICSNCNKVFKKIKSETIYDRVFCSRECYLESAKIYPKTIKLREQVRNRNRSKRYTNNLSDPYVRTAIFKQSGLLKEDIPEKHLIAKRIQLKLLRQSKQLNN